ncbi:hypothetical protein EGW08_013799 [Elysia chlorotica]|uniref:Uncharacterized protein n=1 Tax=Elysia chlorotica TaxID=188477 RepID=A0A433TA17_ELYCH|nr:hypothetical protein EGW08_013799 [Elysia chlorotica]
MIAPKEKSRPSVIHRPGEAGKPSVSGGPSKTEAPIAVKKPSTEEKSRPSVIHRPGEAGKPSVSGGPSKTEAPIAVKKPSTEEKSRPSVIHRPGEAGKPSVSGGPSKTEAPIAVKKPSTEEKSRPSVIHRPGEAGKPSVSGGPSKTEAPIAVKKPSTEEKSRPSVIHRPGEAGKPSVSGGPSKTEAPIAVKKPSTEEKSRPSVIHRPGEAGKPSVSGGPSKTEAPIAVKKPSTEEKSRPSVMNGPGEAGKPSISGRPSKAEAPIAAKKPSTEEKSRPSVIHRPGEAGKPSVLGRPSKAEAPIAVKKPSTEEKSRPSVMQGPGEVGKPSTTGNDRKSISTISSVDADSSRTSRASETGEPPTSSDNQIKHKSHERQATITFSPERVYMEAIHPGTHTQPAGGEGIRSLEIPVSQRSNSHPLTSTGTHRVNINCLSLESVGLDVYEEKQHTKTIDHQAPKTHKHGFGLEIGLSSSSASLSPQLPNYNFVQARTDSKNQDICSENQLLPQSSPLFAGDSETLKEELTTQSSNLTSTPSSHENGMQFQEGEGRGVLSSNPTFYNNPTSVSFRHFYFRPIVIEGSKPGHWCKATNVHSNVRFLRNARYLEKLAKDYHLDTMISSCVRPALNSDSRQHSSTDLADHEKINSKSQSAHMEMCSFLENQEKQFFSSSCEGTHTIACPCTRRTTGRFSLDKRKRKYEASLSRRFPKLASVWNSLKNNFPCSVVRRVLGHQTCVREDFTTDANAQSSASDTDVSSGETPLLTSSRSDQQSQAKVCLSELSSDCTKLVSRKRRFNDRNQSSQPSVKPSLKSTDRRKGLGQRCCEACYDLCLTIWGLKIQIIRIIVIVACVLISIWGCGWVCVNSVYYSIQQGIEWFVVLIVTFILEAFVLEPTVFMLCALMSCQLWKTPQVIHECLERYRNSHHQDPSHTSLRVVNHMGLWLGLCEQHLLQVSIQQGVDWFVVLIVTFILEALVLEPTVFMLCALMSCQLWKTPQVIHECLERFQTVTDDLFYRDWMIYITVADRHVTSMIHQQAAPESASLFHLHDKIHKALRKVISLPDVVFHTGVYWLIIYTVCTLILINTQTDVYQAHQQSTYIERTLGISSSQKPASVFLKLKECSPLPVVKIDELRQCNFELTQDTMETDEFGFNWKDYHHQGSICQQKILFKYNSYFSVKECSPLPLVQIDEFHQCNFELTQDTMETGEFGFNWKDIYSQGRYWTSLSFTTKTSLLALEEIESSDWIDHRTRILVLDFSIINLDSYIVSSYRVKFDFKRPAPFWSSDSFHFRYQQPGNQYYYMILVGFIFLNISAYNVIKEMMLVNKVGCLKYLTKIESYTEISKILLSIALCYLYFRKISLAKMLITDLKFSYLLQEEKFVDFFEMAVVDYLYTIAGGFLAFVCIFQIFVMLSKIKRLLVFIRLLISAVTLFYMPLIVGLAFAFLSYILFGKTTEEFSSFGISYLMVTQYFIKPIAIYERLVEAHPYVGPSFVFLLGFCINFFMVNFFIVFLNEAYSSIQNQVRIESYKVKDKTRLEYVYEFLGIQSTITWDVDEGMLNRDKAIDRDFLSDIKRLKAL